MALLKYGPRPLINSRPATNSSSTPHSRAAPNMVPSIRYATWAPQRAKAPLSHVVRPTNRSESTDAFLPHPSSNPASHHLHLRLIKWTRICLTSNQWTCRLDRNLQPRRLLNCRSLTCSWTNRMQEARHFIRFKTALPPLSRSNSQRKAV